MFGVDGLYGSRPYWQNMIDTARFTEEFFLRVGRTAHWGKSERAFMSESASALAKNFGV